MDVLTALMLTAVGLLLLWVLIIRKRFANDAKDQLVDLPASAAKDVLSELTDFVVARAV